MNKNCYVYLWIETATKKWYIGSRTAAKAHPNDGYICSSKTVLPLIKTSPNDWIRTILATGTAEDMYKLECDLLQTLDARNDPASFNRHNNDMKLCKAGTKQSLETKLKIAKANTGRKHTEEQKKANSLRNTGTKQSAETKAKRAASRKAYYEAREAAGLPKVEPRSAETLAKMSAAQMGKKKPRTPEHQAKLAEARRGKPLSEETKEKIKYKRAQQVMKPLSEETKEKISNGNKGNPKGKKYSVATLQPLPTLTTHSHLNTANCQLF